MDRATHERIQIDLPEVKPLVTRFLTESGYCPHGKRRVRSRHPEQLSEASGAAGVCLGPRAVALAADLKHRLGIPYRKISQLYKLAFGLEVTAGGLCQADARLAEKAEPIYRELVEAIRQSAAVYADETGWRIGILSAWLWVFTSGENHRVHHRRAPLPRGGGGDPGEEVPGGVGERLLYGLRCQGL